MSNLNVVEPDTPDLRHRSANRVIQWAKSVPINLKHIPLDRARRFALRWEGYKDSEVRELPSKRQANYKVVNWLRHQRTDYEALIAKLSNCKGSERAKAIIRNRILDAIASQYPELRREAESQKTMLKTYMW